MSVEFFGEVDQNKSRDGRGSEYPAWYFDGPGGPLATLKNEIREKEQLIARGLVDPVKVLDMKAEIEEKQNRVDQIEASRPNLTGAAKDKVVGQYRDLGEKISEAMYTYKEDNRGTASPQEEVKRMTEPCIEISKEVAKQCGLNVNLAFGGGPNVKVSRTQAEKAWKIMGKAIGERTNVETLRRDG